MKFKIERKRQQYSHKAKNLYEGKSATSAIYGHNIIYMTYKNSPKSCLEQGESERYEWDHFEKEKGDIFFFFGSPKQSIMKQRSSYAFGQCFASLFGPTLP